MRVRFVLSKYALQSGKVIAAVREVFGNRLAKYANSTADVVVECSAERFVRWLVVRNQCNATNSFKDLKLEIIAPVEPTRIESFD